MSANAAKLLTHPLHGEMVKEFGAWIVTKTYTTSRRGVAVLTSSESVVDVTLGVTSASSVELTPSAGWWSRASASAWSIHTEVRVRVDGRVVEHWLTVKCYSLLV
jgi:hypothetical protein